MVAVSLMVLTVEEWQSSLEPVGELNRGICELLIVRFLEIGFEQK